MESELTLLSSMMNDEILPEDHNLCALDKIGIKQGARTAVKVALGLELFIPPRESSILYPQLESLLEDYYHRFGEYLNYYGSPYQIINK